MPTNNELHLPCYLQWKDINTMLNEHLTFLGYKHISEPYLSHLHTVHFKNVKNPKYTRQGKCDKCLELKQNRLQATKD